ncbi:MAG: PilZ domain-containing protein [Chloroflexota bacterium]
MEEIRIGDRVEIHLDAKFGNREGWYAGTVVRIEPYSRHRSFYWVELDDEAQAALGTGMKLISVFNPKNIRKFNTP